MLVREISEADMKAWKEWEELERGYLAYACGLPCFSHESEEFKYGYAQAFAFGEAETAMALGEA